MVMLPICLVLILGPVSSPFLFAHLLYHLNSLSFSPSAMFRKWVCSHPNCCEVFVPWEFCLLVEFLQGFEALHDWQFADMLSFFRMRSELKKYGTSAPKQRLLCRYFVSRSTLLWPWSQSFADSKKQPFWVLLAGCTRLLLFLLFSSGSTRLLVLLQFCNCVFVSNSSDHSEIHVHPVDLPFSPT